MLCICKVFGLWSRLCLWFIGYGSDIYIYIYTYTCEFNFKSMKLLDFSTIVIASNNQGLDGLGLRWECQLTTIK